MTDRQCLMCAKIFSCGKAFKNPTVSCDWYIGDWGTCRKCNRIVSPQHSNCPRCGSRDIRPVCEELRLKEMKNK